MIFENKKDINAVDMRNESIDVLNNRVLEWAERNQEELDTLHNLEEYRKNYVGNISHELKTPIFTIQGYLHTLIDSKLEDRNINMNFLKRAAENADRLQNIVEDLETISKLESGKMHLDKTTFDLKALVSEVIRDLDSLAATKMITLKFKEAASQSYQVVADREYLRQVIVNLIANSIKYGSDGGITKIGFYDLDSEIMCEISDNGIGIAEDHIKHVFDRFYRVDSSRSRKQGGSGLGLSIVKHILEAHDQTINLRSKVGDGSTFSFTIKKA
jgi:two-component system, OmpR family, phosphate regulon sensor histidine kinase PhoR